MTLNIEIMHTHTHTLPLRIRISKIDDMFWWFFVGFFFFLFLLVNILDKPPPPPTLKNDATCLETWYLLYKYCDFLPAKFVHWPIFFKNINFCKGLFCVRAAVQKNWSVNCISLYNAQLIDIVK